MFKKFAITSIMSVILPLLSPAQKVGVDKKWWKETIVYQIYPRSFKDSDGDGVGDLKGIISKLDYIKSLGINAVWLNPIYSSPNDDNGYDISDYRNIMNDFGTMADFDALLKGMHERGIKLIMDLVVNHSSDEHEWFKQSRSSRTSAYRNYYHWWDAERGKPSTRYSLFDVNHDAWKYDSLTNAYYLHYFSRKQPDLNWENPKLRSEVYDIMNFWVAKGIDGFRLDAFQFAAKDTTFPAFPEGYEKNFTLYYAVGPHLHDYLKEMNRQVLSQHDVMSVAEGAGNSFKDAHDLVDADRHELNMAYAFDGISVPDEHNKYSLVHLKEVFTRWDSAFDEKGWLSIFLANHDNARMVSRFGSDSPAYREASSKLLTTFIMTMRGTPYYYNGDELGMTNIGFNKIEDYQDVTTRNEYQHIKNIGGDLSAFLEGQKRTARDNARTPFQWNTSANAGFTTGSPWLRVNANYKTINEAAEDKDPNSVLNYFRKVVKLRKALPELVYGKYELLDKANENIYAYTRTLNDRQVLVLLNFSSSRSTINLLKPGFTKMNVLINNLSTFSIKNNTITMQPWQAIIMRIK